jgi:hypothetical protein
LLRRAPRPHPDGDDRGRRAGGRGGHRRGGGPPGRGPGRRR